MRVLILGRDESTYVTNIYDSIRRRLAREFPRNVYLYGRGYVDEKNYTQYVPDIIEEYGDFDVVFVMDLRDKEGKFSKEPWTGLNEITASKILYRTDIHNCWNVYKKYLIKNNFSAIISPYPESYQEGVYGKHLGLPESIKYIWLPHCVDDIFYSYNEDKVFDVTMLGFFLRSPYLKFWYMFQGFYKYLFNGQMDMITFLFLQDLRRVPSMIFKDDYPLRTYIDKNLKNRCDIKYFTKKHPGHSLGLDYSKKDFTTAKYLVGENYVRAICASKIFLSSSSRFKIPLQKTFQGMACGTCTFVDEPIGAKDLGFEDGYNLVYVDKKNVLDKVSYYLRNEEERETIAKNGLETVRKYHTISLRVRQFINTLEEYI